MSCWIPVVPEHLYGGVMSMKLRLLIVATLCLSLTACDMDASTTPAQQPTDQVTEQTTPAASICKATVTEVNGNTAPYPVK